MHTYCKILKYLLKTLYLLVFLSISDSSFAQGLEKIEPPFWWSDMQNKNLQILVKGDNIGSLKAKCNDASLYVTATHKCDSPNYLFIDLNLNNTNPGYYTIDLLDGDMKIYSFDYEIKKRIAESNNRQGINSSDAVYLITPDRFANGNPSNDQTKDLKEQCDRSSEYGRHGGDIKGIENHLEYIKEMGFTAIWLNPVLINDQPKWSYHGYSTTDYYKVDPRFGSNESYQELAIKAKELGLGMIMDIIVNHCGDNHWWMEDPPFNNWINQSSEEYIQTNHRKETLLDPYASKQDRQNMVDGWFVPTMPDLNQRNTFLSTYLIQNSIWWIEFAHLSAIRQDTYSYPHKEFMSEWTCAIMNEYPNFFIVGEEWIDDPAMISYWQAGKENEDGNNSCLPSLMDFPLCFGLTKALTEKENWDTGLINLYKALTTDYHYPDASQLVIFADNHDMKRCFVQLNEDYELFKMAMAFLLTSRGIPQLYYGTEILMNTGKNGSHGLIRSDFPGGWPNDSVNVKKKYGLSAIQLEAQKYCKTLLKWRQGSSVVHKGKLMHYIPENGIYVYFRYTDEESVMIILNKGEKETDLALNRFQERLSGYNSFKNIETNEIAPLEQIIRLRPKEAYILELSR